LKTTVHGSDGVGLVVSDEGLPNGCPIIFIHGWSQSSLSWKYQFKSDLAVKYRLITYDLRGHGMSEKPNNDEAYNNAIHWADDLLAIIQKLNLIDVILVGWSFGGYVICDYLRRHGESNLKGINFVSWAVMIGDSEKERALTGDGFNRFFGGSISRELTESITAMRGFVRACAEKEISAEDFEEVLAYNMMTPPDVRRAVASRGELDNTPLLEELTIPVLITQGTSDQVTKRTAASHIHKACRNSKESIYEGTGHLPFIEDAKRYNAELDEFANLVFGKGGPR